MKIYSFFAANAKRALFLSICAALISCAGEKDGLQVGILPDVDSIPILAAEKEGFFEKAGAKVTIVRFSSPVNRDTAFQAGSIDGAVSDMLAAILSLNGGFGVRMTSLTNGSYKLLASKNSGIQKPADIAGRDVAMSLNTIIEYCTDRIAAEAGLSAESYAKTVIPQIPVRLEMLNAGKVSAATLPEPLASAAVSGGSGAVVVAGSEELGINPGVILFSDAAIKKKGKEIKAFYRAYNMAVDYLGSTDLSDLEDYLVSEGGFPESVKGVIKLPSYRKATLPDEKEYEAAHAWLLGKKLVSETVPFSAAAAGGFF